MCAACLRPLSACICHWVTPVAHPTEVLILQHPLETRHAKNSARLLHLSLPGSRLLVGEAFDGAALQAAMPEPKYTVLLYPPTAHVTHQTPEPLDVQRLKDPSSLRLVLLDGTWRQSRKMLHQSPLLQALPRWSFNDLPTSNYLVRKAHKPGQLSTLEATCAALAQIDGSHGAFQPLLAAFKGFVAQQMAFVPAVDLS